MTGKKGKELWNILSPDLKVGVTILRGQEKGRQMWLGRVVRALEGDVSKATIQKSVKKMYDLGMIDAEWHEIDSKWTRVLTVSGEARSFFEDIFKRVGG